MKHIIVGGCSFTAYKGCWPTWLQKEIQSHPLLSQIGPTTLYNQAKGGTGNEIIARRLIHGVNKLIKQGINPSDMFVSVMWSGYTRMYIYSDDIDQLRDIFKVKNPLVHNLPAHADIERGKEIDHPPIPDRWPKEDPLGRYFHATPGSADKEHALYHHMAEKWFKYFQNSTMDLARTYEQVLRVQWYLNSLNIKYIMQSYNPWWDGMYHSNPDANYTNVQVEHLYEMIDWSKFTDISCTEWIKDHGKVEWTTYDSVRKITREPGDGHPTSLQMQEYTQEYLWPTILEKGILNA